MKNWKRYLAVALLFCFAVTIVPIKAHADAFTASMIGSLAYGIGTGMGISFTAGNATGQGMTDYMTGQVEQYVNSHGGSLTSLFTGQAAINAAGKLVVGHTLYNEVRDFIGWLSEKYDLSSVNSWMTEGLFGGKFIPYEGEGETEGITGVGYEVSLSSYQAPSESKPYNGYRVINLYNNGQLQSAVQMTGKAFPGGYSYVYRDGKMYFAYDMVNVTTGETSVGEKVIATVGNLENSLSWSVPENWGMPQPLPQDKQWEGDFGGSPGWAEPQDLPDFLSKIPPYIANGDLEVTGQIVEAETGGEPPTPSPSPSPEPTPSYNKQGIALLIAEIVALINSLSGDTAVPEEQIEDIAQQVADTANTIPDAITQTGTRTQTAIQEATQTITDTMTDTQTQTQTAIQDATQTITDTMSDTQTQTQTAIQDATQTITDTITDITEVPDDFEPQKHPLPRGVFPFCIPFDLHDFIVALSADPVTPEIHVPFDLNLPLPGGNVLPFHYQFDLDLHEFDGLAAVLRTLEFIAFGVGLLFVTGKVIKW